MRARGWLAAAVLTAGLAREPAARPRRIHRRRRPAGPVRARPGGQLLSSIPSYAEVVRQMRSIESSSQGAVEVASAGQSGEGRS